MNGPSSGCAIAVRDKKTQHPGKGYLSTNTAVQEDRTRRATLFDLGQ